MRNVDREALEWQALERLVEDCLQASSTDEREALIAAACAQDAALEARVRQLLQRCDADDEFLELPAPELLTSRSRRLAAAPSPGSVEGPAPTAEPRAEGVAADLGPSPARQHPLTARIGPYRLLRELGRGGTSWVFEARHETRPDQPVALKLLLPPLSSGEARSRLRHEQEILSSLAHPSIARLLDSGETETGQSYLVVEYVDGMPITEYCEERRLDLLERLRLFLRVCEGVAHAHEHFVVHRDLKPTNILVAENGEPLLLDFGIAKVVAADARQEETATRERMLTPSYASPEHLRGEPLTTASDTYSLGVLLYRLLTGVLPFAPTGEPTRTPAASAQRPLPARPSAAVAAPPPRAGHPPATRERLRRILRGDLDAIVLRALREEPARRYRTVEALMADITRFLQGRPVKARPGTTAYRVRKFWHRHAIAATTATLGFFILLAFATTLFWLSLRLRDERNEAQAHEAVAEEAGRRAELERQKSDEVVDVLMEALEANSRRNGLGATAKELLDEAAALSARRSSNDDATRAAVARALASGYRSLGLYDRAAELLEVGAASLDDIHDERALQLELGFVEVSRGNFEAARKAAARALEVSLALYPHDHPDVAEALDALAYVLFSTGLSVRAEEPARRALAARRQHFGDHSAEVAASLYRLSDILNATGDYRGARQAARTSLDLLLDLEGTDSLAAAAARNNLATALQALGKYDAAADHFRGALAVFEKHHGSSHPEVATLHSNLGIALHQAGRLDEALPAYEQALSIYRRFHPSDHPKVINVYGNLGTALAQRGDRAAALPYFRDAHRLAIQGLPLEHPVRLRAMNNLAVLLGQAGIYEEAEPLLRETIRITRATAGERQLPLAINLLGLADILISTRHGEEALRLANEATAIVDASLPDGHWQREVCRNVVAAANGALGRHQEATDQLISSRDHLRRLRGADSYEYLEAERRLREYRERTG